MSTQLALTFSFPIERAFRLRDVESELEKVMATPPSRTTLLAWLDDGTLEGKKMSFGWIVWESSLRKLILSMQRDNVAA